MQSEPEVFLTETNSELSFDISSPGDGEVAIEESQASVDRKRIQQPTSPPPDAGPRVVRGMTPILLGGPDTRASGGDICDPSCTLTQQLKRTMKYEEIYTMR